ncbi:rhodanese family protein [Sphingosinicella xenopeptidilytica]|uniref:Rhodanese family protein n=1 Tax=Sphingosinicella xenopeptidilytica TaxID=364098 RepID=A0ABW3C389_SPHXN
MTMIPVTPAEARRLIEAGAQLIDIREPDEHAREHIPGAANVPVGALDRLETSDCAVVFHCRSGARTEANAPRLAAAAEGPCYMIEGGIDAWHRAGLDVSFDRRQPLELMRQVQLAAGGLALLGVTLGFLVDSGFFALSAFVGAGLMVAGATGWCGMARLLKWMPWNRGMAAKVA